MRTARSRAGRRRRRAAVLRLRAARAALAGDAGAARADALRRRRCARRSSDSRRRSCCRRGPVRCIRPWLLARREGLPATAAFADHRDRAACSTSSPCWRCSRRLLPGRSIPACRRWTRRCTARCEPGALRAGSGGGGRAGRDVRAAPPIRRGSPRWWRGARRGCRPARAALVDDAVAVVRRGAGRRCASRAHLALALAWSLPLWLVIAAQIWVVSLALGVMLPLAGSLLVMALLVVGVAVPTPGAVGGFHEAYRLAATVVLRRRQRPRGRRRDRPARRRVRADADGRGAG